MIQAKDFPGPNSKPRELIGFPVADLIKPHGSDHLMPMLLESDAREAELGRAESLRKALSEGDDIPAEFSPPEVLEILREYYAQLSDEDNVEVKLHDTATGDKTKK